MIMTIMHIILRSLLLFSLIILIPIIGYSTTPLITGVTGTVSQGQALTISGSTMIDENKTNWGTAYQSGTKYGFEGSSYTGDGYADASDSNSQERGYDTDVKLMGAKSFKGRIYGTSSSCPTDNHSSGIYIDLSEDGVSGQDIYVRLYSRWNSTGTGSVWPSNHIKMLDVQGTGDQLYFQPVAGNSLPTQMNMVYDSTNHNYTVANFLQEQRWYCMEVRFKSSDTHNMTAWVDGVQLASSTPSSVGSYSYVLFNMINACGFEDLDLTNWTDNFTVSTSRIYCSTKVEICDSATYSGATCVQQPLTTISDNSIVITADLTGLTGDKYLYVTNNKQETSSAYNLSGSSASGSFYGGSCAGCTFYR